MSISSTLFSKHSCLLQIHTHAYHWLIVIIAIFLIIIGKKWLLLNCKWYIMMLELICLCHNNQIRLWNWPNRSNTIFISSYLTGLKNRTGVGHKLMNSRGVKKVTYWGIFDTVPIDIANFYAIMYVYSKFSLINERVSLYHNK